MQIIQSPLGNNVHPLGVRSSLSYPHEMLLRKESNSLHSQSNIISSIQTKPPLVTSSKFFLSRKHESTIQPLIDWENGEIQDINSEFPLVESDSYDSRDSLKNSNINSSESVKDSITEIMPTRIDKNTSNDTSEKLNNKGKSKSTKTNKSQQPLEKKSKPKSKTKKTVKSSAAKNVAQFVDESNIPINRNQDSLLVSDEPLPVEANSDLPKLQRNVASNNTISDNDSVSSRTPSITSSTSPSVEDKSTLFRNIANDDVQLNSELPSSLPSPELEAIAPKISATSPENGETAIAAKISATSPENGEVPVVSATSPENGETVIAPKISTTSPENGETVIAPKISATSPENGEVPVVSATSPENGETVIAPKISATSPENGEVPVVSATSPENG
ncbi:hypothetical protein, partial [Nostoc sp.]|uniref:hypothetical protein n=1 Tax=Nostoc sp. TaxID=1180 RepID=UPI002FF45107